MNNKELDHLFSSSLSTLDKSPSANVWKALEAKLSKKKRRILPLWWFSGAAAILIISLFFFLPNEDSNTLKITPEIEVTNNSNTEKLNKNNKEITVQKEADIPIVVSIPEEQKQYISAIAKTKDTRPETEEENGRLKIDYLFNNKQGELKSFDLTNKLISEIYPTKKLDINLYLAQEETEKSKENLKNNNWSVAPVLGLMSSNSFTEASPISDNLANNTVGENNTNFGVQVAYKINDKWAIQSGIHRLNMSYSNQGIAIFNSNDNNRNAVSFNTISPTFYAGDFLETASVERSSLTNIVGTNSSLTQNFGYLEIPLEIAYKFLSAKKFSSNVISGFSTLFLTENEVLLSTENLLQQGEFTTLNNLNFSANFGLDLNYLFNNKWSFHFNPMMKIQLNTFNDTHNFAPFNIGVYSGIRYQF